MATCLRCGSFTESASGICQTCESSSRHIGTPEDVPCQRCGMYLPPHELKMWNSRLYCAYCIMDIQDEENMMHKREKREQPGEGGEGRGQEFGKSSGVCEKCGRQAETMYAVGGRRFCSFCYEESGGAAGGSGQSGFGLFVQQLRQLIRMPGKPAPSPKAIPAQPPQSPQVFGIRSRRLEEAKQSASTAPLQQQDKATGAAGSEGRPPPAQKKGGDGTPPAPADSPWAGNLNSNLGGKEEKYSLPPRASERRFVLKLKKGGEKKE